MLMLSADEDSGSAAGKEHASVRKGSMSGRRRVRVQAICFGAGDYKNVDKLVDAPKDARTLHAKIEATEHCRCILALDPQSKEEMRRQLAELADACYTATPEITIVFFAGHGCQLTTGPLAMFPCDFTSSEDVEKMEGELFTLNDLLQVLRESHSKDHDIPVLFIMDACRKAVPGHSIRMEAAETYHEERTTVVCSCSRAQLAEDESSFFKDLLDPLQGLFAVNMPLRDALLFVLRRSRTRTQWGRSFSLEDVPERFCINHDPTCGADRMEMLRAIRRLFEWSEPKTSTCPPKTSTCPPPADKVIVAAYSPRAKEEAENLKSELLAVIEGALKGLQADTSEQKFCCLFLSLFLRYEETKFASEDIQNELLTTAKNNPGRFLKHLEPDLRAKEITSASFSAWIHDRCPQVAPAKLIFAALDFSVRREMDRMLQFDPDRARREREEWDANVTSVGYTDKVEFEDAMKLAEQHLRLKLFGEPGEERTSWLSVGILDKVVETGSYVVFMETTSLVSACLSQFLADQVRTRIGGRGAGGELFRTWMSSSGWLSSTCEYRELRQSVDKEEEEKLIQDLKRVGQLAEFVDWKTLQRGGEREAEKAYL
eukprot:748089-Hanusia_phi.AAC.1